MVRLTLRDVTSSLGDIIPQDKFELDWILSPIERSLNNSDLPFITKRYELKSLFDILDALISSMSNTINNLLNILKRLDILKKVDLMSIEKFLGGILSKINIVPLLEIALPPMLTLAGNSIVKMFVSIIGKITDLVLSPILYLIHSLFPTR